MGFTRTVLEMDKSAQELRKCIKGPVTSTDIARAKELGASIHALTERIEEEYYEEEKRAATERMNPRTKGAL